MQRSTRRALRIAFLTVATLFTLLGLVTLTATIAFRPPGDNAARLLGGLTYLTIAAISVFAARRLKSSTPPPPGFEVVQRTEKVESDAR